MVCVMALAHNNNHHKSQESLQAGGAGELFVVATPIGNLGDITLRALETLKSVDAIACEDTRTSGALLSHYGITTRTLSYHDHNEASMTPKLVEQLQHGMKLALISDAGTPLVSDPGARLVATAAQAGIRVTPLPGASALLAGLTMAALPTDAFYFGGFLPQKKQALAEALLALKTLPATLAFYEAPHRLVDTLQALHEHLGDRTAAVAREITKLYEECPRGTLSQLLAHFTAYPPRGECVVLVQGMQAQDAMDDAAIDHALTDAMARLSLKEAVAEVTAVSGRAKRDVYQRALTLAGK